MRRTKIVCTIGPASDSLEVLKDLIAAGMNVARLNFSHGSQQDHAERISRIRRAEEESEATVGILLDTKGPEIRTGMLRNGEALLRTGEQVVLTTEESEGDSRRVSVSYAGLPEDVTPGSTILIDDGLINLEVLGVEKTEILCHIKHGGVLKNQKGVNVPGVAVRLPGITEKDTEDIRFGLEQGVDFIAASFVRQQEDILAIRAIVEEAGKQIPIIAKLENRQAIQNIGSLLAVADGVMVARGDLGVEIPVEEVPVIQKDVIHKANLLGKPVITATQMLDSMQRNPRPTRAEASDVANAILDGTDAVMLSGETAAGKFPVEAVKTMARIAVTTEKAILYREVFAARSAKAQNTTADAISQAVANVALDLQAAAIITPTESGYTARLISKYRPKCPILAVTPWRPVMRQLTLSWGVVPLKGAYMADTDQMLRSSVDVSLASGMIRYGDLVVITAGVPIGHVGTTNILKVHIVGDIVAKGQGIGHAVVTARVVVADSLAELKGKMYPGAILVTRSTDKEMMPYFRMAAAVITEEGGLTSHAAVVGLNLATPVVVGVENANGLLKDGMEVTVDAERGHIYTGKATVL